MIGLIGAYIWKSNGKLQKSMMDALERIEKGQEETRKEIAQGQKEIAQMLFNQTRILERIEGKIPA